MANYTELKTAVSAVIKTNNNQEITGQLLQDVLNNIISVIGANATFAGIATPDTTPGTPDQNVFYIAGQSGVYANFGGYEVTKNAVVFNNVSGNWVATELNLLSSDFGDSAVYDMAYSGYLPVDLGHLYSHSSGMGHYIANNLWDAVTLRIYNPTGKLEVTGANVAIFVFFDEPRIKDTYLQSNTTGIIPPGAKLCVLDMRKSDNPNGYANLRIRQYGSGADKGELSLLNENALQVFGDVYDMAVKFDDEDITPEAITGQWFNPDVPGLVVNANYKCYKLDVSGYVGKVLHGYTFTSGTMWSCSMTDENNAVVARFNYRKTGDRQPGIVERMFYIGSNVKYLYINCASGFMDAFIKTTKRELNANKVDIAPVNMKMRDVATYIGEPFLIPNHYAELSGGASDNGDIKPADGFDLVVIKLLSDKPIVVEGATCKYYLFYNSGDLKNETYLGMNTTGNYIAGAKYAVLLFEKAQNPNGINYNQIRIVQDGTIIKIDDVVRKTELEPIAQTSNTQGQWINSTGGVSINENFHYTRFEITDVTGIYLLSSAVGGSTSLSYVHYYNVENTWLGSEYAIKTPAGTVDYLTDQPLTIPKDTSYILVNAAISFMPTLKLKSKGDYFDFEQMETYIKNIKGELSLLNENALQVFGDVYDMAVKFDDEDITPEAITGQWFNPDVPGLVVNANYKCYKLDVSGYVGKVLHGYTFTSGTMWSCSMTDENNAVVARFNYRKTGDRQPGIVERMFYIGSNVKYLYINCASGFMDAFIKTTKRELNANKVDIAPVNMKMRDVATYIGEPFLIPNHYAELSGGASDNGDIKPADGFDLVVIKLLSDKPIVVEGATCKYYLFYNSGDLKNETYLGMNTTGNYIAGAKYAVLLFEKAQNPNGINYNQIRIVQDGTIIKIDDVVRKTELEPIAQTSNTQGQWINSTGGVSINENFHYTRFEITDVTGIYLLSSAVGGSTSLSYVHYYNVENTWLGSEYAIKTPAGTVDYLTDQPLTIPKDTSYILVNAAISFMPTLKLKSKGDYFDFEQMETDIKNIKGNKKLIKLHIYDTEPGNGANAFYVRAKYNDTKDILLQYYINGNTLLSPCAAYVGLNTLSDTDLMTSANLVSNHSDSTAPLFQSSLYWHLYAQHGYVIPVIPNTVGLTTADIGALWKDQLDRQYNIGNVVGSSIYLLPVITRGSEGNDTRGWKTPSSPAITALTHVSGGTVTTPITVVSQSATQLRPIMKHENRKFYIDGRELTEPGDYEGDDFTVSESQIGYDPASIETWFPTPGAIGTPNLTGAVEMARFTWSYNFRGAQCCVNTTIDIRRKVECQSYGATQQQTFVDTGNYKAMFMIPKAKPQNGVDLEKPFNSPALSSTSYGFFRNTTYLQDVDKPIDRLIAMLHNPNDNTYLVGMAAGLSLVSGETIPAKRNVNIPIATSTDEHQRLGSFSASNRNKFYIAAINTALFADDGYNLPNTYFKEINYYISYFDPAANPGQCYWYKDGNSYIIYSHCQSVQSRVPLALPDFMEGLSVEIVEQTDNAVLLTDTIQNGKLFVSYNTDDANYLVLRTK